jgi:hypothetical protein
LLEHARPGPAQAPTTTPAPSSLPTGTADVLAGLLLGESRAATAHRAGCLAATGEVAALLASLCAAETAHADLRRRPGTGTGPGPGQVTSVRRAPGEAPDAPAPQTVPTEAIWAEGMAALAAMLSGAHAAVFACAAAGGALAPSGEAGAVARALARDAYDAHRALRDSLTETIVSAGGKPPQARAAYALPTRPVDLGSALGLLSDIEDRTATLAYGAVPVLGTQHRGLAVDALAGAAVRAQRERLAAGVPPEGAGRALPGR